MAASERTNGLSLSIQILTVEQNLLFSLRLGQIKQLASQKMFRKSSRQYLENQQKVLSSPDSPCQKVLNSLKFMPDNLIFFWLFIHPCVRGVLLNREEAIYVIEYAFYVFLFDKQMS